MNSINFSSKGAFIVLAILWVCVIAVITYQQYSCDNSLLKLKNELQEKYYKGLEKKKKKI